MPGRRGRAKRTADQSAPPNTTIAPTPLPDAGEDAGQHAEVVLADRDAAVGAIAPCIGAASITPMPRPVNTSSTGAHPVADLAAHRAGRRCRGPATGTLITAPSRKKTRNVPRSQPVEAPVASAAEASANSARANVQAPWWGAFERDQRTAVAWANTVAIGGGEEGETGDHGRAERTGSRRRPRFGAGRPGRSNAVARTVPPHFENPVTSSVP